MTTPYYGNRTPEYHREARPVAEGDLVTYIGIRGIRTKAKVLGWSVDHGRSRVELRATADSTLRKRGERFSVAPLWVVFRREGA